MVKQGGNSWNGSVNSKQGLRSGKHTCQYCGRGYKQEWTKQSHENTCKDYHRVRVGKTNIKEKKDARN
jgi:hypothetical protein